MKKYKFIVTFTNGNIENFTTGDILEAIVAAFNYARFRAWPIGIETVEDEKGRCYTVGLPVVTEVSK